MEVYEVISTNLDCNDGFFVNVLFDTVEKAIDFCQQELEDKKPKDVVEDFEGKLDTYQDKSLKYSNCEGCPAIYYKSNYGSYRCVVYVKTRKVH